MSRSQSIQFPHSLLLLVALFLAAAVVAAASAPHAVAGFGDPDGYGGDGRARVPFPPGVDSIAFDLLPADGGGTWVAGRAIFRQGPQSESGAFVAKVGDDGKLDPGFGDAGTVTDLAGSGSRGLASALELDAEGRLLVAGWTGRKSLDVFVARFDAGGALDLTFGDGGIAIAPWDEGTEVPQGDSLAVDSDGRIFVGVRARQPGSRGFLSGAIAFTSSGQPDPSFSSDGRRHLPGRVISPGDGPRRFDVCTGCTEGDLALDGEGRILISGEKGGKQRFAVVRLGADGSLDRSFGTRGHVYAGPLFEGTERIEFDGSQVLVTPNGKIVLAAAVARFDRARRGRDTGAGLGMVRLRRDGAIDRRFGAKGSPSGFVTVPVDARWSTLNDLEAAPDGGLLVAGSATTRRLDERFVSASFTAGGKPLTAGVIGGFRGQANAVAHDGLGRTILGGWSGDQHASLVLAP